MTPGTDLGCKLLVDWKPAFTLSQSLSPIVTACLKVNCENLIDAAVC